MSGRTEPVIEELYQPLIAWLEIGGDPEPAIVEYWKRRRVLLSKIDAIDPGALAIYEGTDSLTDMYDPRASHLYPVTEGELRAELARKVAAFRALGYLPPKARDIR